MRKRLSSLLEQESFPFYVCIFNDFLVFIIKKHGSNFTNELDLVLNRMTKTTELYLEVSIDIGVSETHCSFAELSNAYEQAQLALSCNRYNTVTRISWYNQFNDQDIIQIPYRRVQSAVLKHAGMPAGKRRFTPFPRSGCSMSLVRYCSKSSMPSAVDQWSRAFY